MHPTDEIKPGFPASIRTGTAPVNNVDQAVDLMRMAMYESSVARMRLAFRL